MLKRKRITITGRVQGVGCRPYFHRKAGELGLTGFIYNNTRGVTVEVQGPAERIERFVGVLRTPRDWPPLMEVAAFRTLDLPIVEEERRFSILRSDTDPDEQVAQVTVDTGVCGDCLREMRDPGDFRFRYPFINCTNCGPRYSIVRTIPYDRANTTMAAFEMCGRCGHQYVDPGDRRFHAQPVACPECGPRVFLTDSRGDSLEATSDKAIARTAQIVRSGGVAAIKGLGGFHLAVDAHNEDAVRTLRERKHRDAKPFALMAGSVEAIGQYVLVSEPARKLLTSPRSPIVLLPIRPTPPVKAVAPSVAPGMSRLGFMLAYTPLHQMLFAEPGMEVLVMTSANISDQPLICDNEEALRMLGGIADAFLMHDRDIYRQVDDSVVQFVQNEPAVIRRSRGYVPEPVVLERPSEAEIFAAGADLKNTFCLVKGTQCILSEHIGDLEDALVYRHYKRSIPHLSKLFRVEPTVVACDLHPGYLSSQYARVQEAEKVVAVQHHWAHIASVLAEHQVSEPVIGLAADGTGLGTDGAIWGGECMVASLREFTRVGQLRYYTLAGADQAAREPIRPLMGLLRTRMDGPRYLREYAGLLERIEPDRARVQVIADQIEKTVNTVKTSSVGRLFDAVAAMLGLGEYNEFEAQLPMLLESVAAPDVRLAYEMPVEADFRGMLILDFAPMLDAILEDEGRGYSASVIAAKFHNGLADGLARLAMETRTRTSLRTVALSGGVFCNRYLSNRLIDVLKSEGFSVLWNRTVPANDGGIALGQAAVAAETIAAGRAAERNDYVSGSTR